VDGYKVGYGDEKLRPGSSLLTIHVCLSGVRVHQTSALFTIHCAHHMFGKGRSRGATTGWPEGGARLGPGAGQTGEPRRITPQGARLAALVTCLVSGMVGWGAERNAQRARVRLVALADGEVRCKEPRPAREVPRPGSGSDATPAPFHFAGLAMWDLTLAPLMDQS
jgi:hypothetical protein